MRNLKSFWLSLWGANAFLGQILMFLVGFCLSALAILVFKVKADARLIAIVLTATGWVTLRLSAWAMDKTEGRESWILTFTFVSIFGMVLAHVIVGAVVNPKEVGIDSVVACSIALAIYVSYYRCGQLSRERVHQVFEEAWRERLPNVLLLCSFLKAARDHKAVRSIQEALMALEFDVAEKAIRGIIGLEASVYLLHLLDRCLEEIEKIRAELRGDDQR